MMAWSSMSASLIRPIRVEGWPTELIMEANDLSSETSDLATSEMGRWKPRMVQTDGSDHRLYGRSKLSCVYRQCYHRQ